MKLYLLFHFSPLYIAIEKENEEIAKLLLSSEKLDPNVVNIFYH